MSCIGLVFMFKQEHHNDSAVVRVNGICNLPIIVNDAIKGLSW